MAENKHPCEYCGEMVSVDDYCGDDKEDGSSEYMCEDCYGSRADRTNDQTIFGEGIYLLMKKHGISFTEGKELALIHIRDQPGILSYMVKNWERHNELTNQPRRER